LQDFRDLLTNNPWKVMWCWTLVHFAILSFRGGALYNYYHHFADKTAMFRVRQDVWSRCSRACAWSADARRRP